MATLSDITLRVAREIGEVLSSTATAGAATSITDTARLVQPNQYWDQGTVWILSGTHLGKFAVVTGYGLNKLTFATMTTTVGTCRYTVARATYPLHILIQSVTNALDEIRVTEIDSTLTGDGTTLNFALPAGVADVFDVVIEETGGTTFHSSHWQEKAGYLKFDYGYYPMDGETIHIHYQAYHDAPVDYDDEIHEDVNLEWLKWKACEHALYYGAKMYQDAKEFRIEEIMNKVIERQRGLIPARVIGRLRTAGV